MSDAILGQGLRGDMEATSRTIKGLTWQRGFTNMAQGIANAEILEDIDAEEHIRRGHRNY